MVRVEHSPRAVAALIGRIAALEPDPGEVRVVIEARHGLLVERLVDAGFVVVPVNPELIARRRGPAKKKDDVEDARIACLLALDRFERLRPLIPHGEIAAELRAIGRDEERAARDERRLLNRLRADLLAVFPAALASPGRTWVRPGSCACSNAGRPPRRWRRFAGRSWWSGLVPSAPATSSSSPTGSRPRWPLSSSPRRRTWCAPRWTPSGLPPRSCCSSARSGGLGAAHGWTPPRPEPSRRGR